MLRSAIATIPGRSASGRPARSACPSTTQSFQRPAGIAWPPGVAEAGQPGARSPSCADPARQEETWPFATTQPEATARSMGIAAEISAILDAAAPEAIHVVYCDEAVADADADESGDAIRLSPHGGGGTAFRPVFDWIAGSDIRPVCAVYLTDIYGSEFGPAPDYQCCGSAPGRRPRRSGR